MGEEGLEPSILSEHGPKPCAPACLVYALGETRTLKGFPPLGPKPSAYANSATKAFRVGIPVPPLALSACLTDPPRADGRANSSTPASPEIISNIMISHNDEIKKRLQNIRNHSGDVFRA